MKEKEARIIDKPTPTKLEKAGQIHKDKSQK